MDQPPFGVHPGTGEEGRPAPPPNNAQYIAMAGKLWELAAAVTQRDPMVADTRRLATVAAYFGHSRKVARFGPYTYRTMWLSMGRDTSPRRVLVVQSGSEMSIVSDIPADAPTAAPGVFTVIAPASSGNNRGPGVHYSLRQSDNTQVFLFADAMPYLFSDGFHLEFPPDPGSVATAIIKNPLPVMRPAQPSVIAMCGKLAGNSQNVMPVFDTAVMRRELAALIAMFGEPGMDVPAGDSRYVIGTLSGYPKCRVLCARSGGNLAIVSRVPGPAIAAANDLSAPSPLAVDLPGVAALPAVMAGDATLAAFESGSIAIMEWFTKIAQVEQLRLSEAQTQVRNQTFPVTAKPRITGTLAPPVPRLPAAGETGGGVEVSS